MRIESTLSAPVEGLSTYAPQNRDEGYASEQINLRSDPLTKLSKRPPLVWDGRLNANANSMKHYANHGNEDFLLVVEDDGTVKAFDENLNPVTVTGSLTQSYIQGGDLVSRTQGKVTYVLNRNKVVAEKVADDSVEYQANRATHINVTAALNYGEKVTLRWVSRDTGATFATVTYSVPELGTTPDYDTADKARATDTVASELATLMVANMGVSAVSKGSSVIVNAPAEWPQLEVDTGQGGKSVVVMNKTIQDLEGLPRYGKAGTILTVKPNPSNEKGTYYIKAVPVTTAMTGFEPQEVVWTETRSPVENHSMDETTMPHIIEFDEDTRTFLCGPAAWEERESGDNDSSPMPAFVGKRIVDLTVFQNRLTCLTPDEVVTTKTDRLFDFWRESALQRLVTDPVSIKSSASDIEDLHHLALHNRDLMIISPNAQFKVDGGEALTPQSASMMLMTRYDVDVSVQPVSMGNSIFLPISYGGSAGLLEYTGERDKVDEGKPITDHVVGLLKGSITNLTSNSNLNMIIVTTTEGLNNELFVFEQFYPEERTDRRSTIVQKAWSRWHLPQNDIVEHIEFRGNKLVVLCDVGNILHKHVRMYTKLGYTTPDSVIENIYLDDYIEVSVVGDNIPMPVDYTTDDTLTVVVTDGAKYPLQEYKYIQEGSNLRLPEDVTEAGVCKAIVGRRMVSEYKPTRPFRRDEGGSIITSDRLRINRYILEVVDTYELKLQVDSDLYPVSVEQFTSPKVGGLTSKLGERIPYTGRVQFSFSNEASQATATFVHDDYLNCSISTIGWLGQYYQTSRRI